MKLCKYFLMSFPAEGVWLGKIGNNLLDSKAADASLKLAGGFFRRGAGDSRIHQKKEEAMLVFLSDVHLTDGTSGQTIQPTAFRIFAESVTRLARSVKDLREIKVVLLGDIFDVIRSSRWLANQVRPWDDASPGQGNVVKNIVDGILNSQANSDSIGHIHSIAEAVKGTEIPFSVEYVMGNHDWIINRYPLAIQAVADKLAMGDVKSFPAELYFPRYSAYACHGDKFDSFNFTGDRNASSIGDAIVIELLNRFPNEVEKRLNGAKNLGIKSEEKKQIVDLLKEIDNVRPLLDVPAWVLMVQKKIENDKVRRMIDETWHSCVHDFLKLDYIKKFDKFLWPDLVDGLEFVLKLSSHASGGMREKIAGIVKSFMADTEGDKYQNRAYDELKRNRAEEASYVLYGHTHNHKVIPLDQVPNNTLVPDNKIYFNTGTWRKTWNRTVFDRMNLEFIGWHVLTYVALFRDDENDNYNFEIWNSALG